MKQLKFSHKQILIFSLILVLTILLGGGYLFAKSTAKHTPTAGQLALPTPQPTMAPQVRGLINTIAKKTTLPEDETPNVATVSDVNKLQNQPFFAKAKNGDKVLIYILSKKAILYRPSTGQIIQESAVEVATDETASPSAEASNSTTLKIKF